MLGANRPRPSLPMSPLDRALQAAAMLGAFVLAGALIAIPTMMPPRVPLHFGVSGEPDRWGSPLELMFLPAIGLVMWIGLELLARMPHVYNYPVKITEENAARQYAIAVRMVRWLSAWLIWLFAWLLLQTARVASGAASQMSPAVVIVPIVAIFGIVAWYITRAIRER